jgi:predicted O-linked N-acetylglucosamine transferase (SPINDLY family)
MAIQQEMAAAIAHHQAGRLSPAEAGYRKILAARPQHAPALHLLGVLLSQTGKQQDAEALLRKAIAAMPDFAEAHGNLGMCLFARGKLDAAIASYRRALKLNPNLPEAHCNLGTALLAKGQVEEAVACLRLALQLRPDQAGIYSNLGNVLAECGRLDEAVDCFNRAAALRPDLVGVQVNLANALANRGDVERSIAVSRTALERHPTCAFAHGNLLYAMHFVAGIDPQSIFAEHKAWNERHAQPLIARRQRHDNDPTTDRRLKVGYVSADFRSHSVAYFIEPLLAHHDRDAVEVYCYADVPSPDKVTARLQQLAQHWRDIAGLSNTHLAERIRADRIDILVDLAGHTANNRLLAFAEKPASVQVTYLGYPDTTGLSAIDFRLTDAFADPPGTTDSLHTEQLVRLQGSFLCFNPMDDSPPPTSLPAASAGHVTFGTFNALRKFSDQAIALWAGVLSAVPKSRLLIKNTSLADDSTRKRLIERFSANGIPADRLDLRGRVSMRSGHLRVYDEVDIALDTFPYHGTTTTCEALWMGVPVISLAGATHVSRVGVSILSNVGLTDLIANSNQDFVQIAASLASDLARLVELRSTLRDRLRSSPLMDARSFATNVELAFRQMWHSWCRTNNNQQLTTND